MSDDTVASSSPVADNPPSYAELLALYQTAASEGPNGSPRAKTFEEFKVHYAMLRKRNLQPHDPAAVEPPTATTRPTTTRNDVGAAPAPGAEGPHPVAAAAPQPVPRRGRFGNFNPIAAGRNVFRRVPDIPLWRILIGAYLMFGGFGFVGFMTVFILYCIAEQVRRWAGTLHVRRVHTDTARTFVGSLFATVEPHTEHSTTVKVTYMILKCIEAFVISFYPNYSLDRLEMELQTDGIVR